MKALVLKDIYVLSKQVRVFLVMILFFSAIPGSFNAAFAVVYMAMLPYTAIAYDERSKWDQLAAMMPYATRDIVLSKYVLGWLGTAAAAVISLVLQTVISVVTPYPGRPDPVTSAMAFCASLCILAITMPLMFRFGVEKRRLVMFLIIFLVCGASGAFSSIAVQGSDGGLRLPAFLTAALPIAAVVLSAVSIPLSMRLYRRRSI